MIQLVYISTPVKQVSNAVLDFVPKAKVFNELHNITGMLISDSTLYAQVLEGGKHEVDALFESIKRDSRHTNVRLISYVDVKMRDFGSWGMKFVDVPKNTHLGELSPAQILKLLTKTAASVIRRKHIMYSILGGALFITLISATFVAGPMLEAHFSPPLTNLIGTVTKKEGISGQILIVGARNLEKNCKVNGILVAEEDSATKVLQINDPRSARFTAVIEVFTPPANAFEYNVSIWNKCSTPWDLKQTVIVHNH